MHFVALKFLTWYSKYCESKWDCEPWLGKPKSKMHVTMSILIS